MLQPRMQSFVAAIRFFDNRTANRCAALQHIDDVLAFPAAPADDHELGGGFPICSTRRRQTCKMNQWFLRGSIVLSITKYGPSIGAGLGGCGSTAGASGATTTGGSGSEARWASFASSS